ncbi:hypothetical protein PoB_007231200 [Plakobranchus ocellatus]|uniref:Uncharacterized protein n=1 Tax=Plakobranchus ocellatus TaxID=259542 RepID=A0AAV4DNC9_9GAST|nr:hypothetical protein PoB_007231200 [Plakobranchus ocellatus]
MRAHSKSATCPRKILLTVDARTTRPVLLRKFGGQRTVTATSVCQVSHDISRRLQCGPRFIVLCCFTRLEHHRSQWNRVPLLGSRFKGVINASSMPIEKQQRAITNETAVSSGSSKMKCRIVRDPLCKRLSSAGRCSQLTVSRV